MATKKVKAPVRKAGSARYAVREGAGGAFLDRATYKRSAKPKARARAGDDELAASIEAGLKQAIAHARGKPAPGTIVHKAIDVAAIRARTGLSQAAFAKRFGLDVTALQAWEQGRRAPERTAQILLRVIDNDPEAVVAALARG